MLLQQALDHLGDALAFATFFVLFCLVFKIKLRCIELSNVWFKIYTLIMTSYDILICAFVYSKINPFLTWKCIG